MTPRFLVLFLLLMPALAAGAEIYLGENRAKPGETVTAPVGFAAKGQAVASLQFDLEYNASAIEPKVEAGPTALQASKTLTSRAVAPGKLRVMLLGSNRAALKDGAVAILTIQVSPKAPAGRHVLKLSNLVAADGDGRKIALTGADGSIVVK